MTIDAYKSMKNKAFLVPSGKSIAWPLSILPLSVLVWIAVVSITYAQQAATDEIPRLQKNGAAEQLLVDGKPFLILGGELGNSAATSSQFMEPVWPRLAKLNLNTVLVPAYWDLIEPEEGKFDFTLIDNLLAGARQNKLRVVFLWFGTWKNSMSCYAPGWVKTNEERFSRAQNKEGRGMELLSPFVEANVTADAKAFAVLMRHLREIDGKQHTVLMVQVENEIGMIPEARDWSELASKLYHQSVPSELMDYLTQRKDNLIPEFRKAWEAAGGKTAGTWEEVFGSGLGTEEIFTAWYFARYTNRVAQAGKAEYPLPMYVNAALIRPNYAPGRYPSGGPLPHLMDVWHAGAPSIDMLCPDIYFPNFVEWCEKYHRSSNPLFIPEAMRGSRSAANVFYAVGEQNAIGLCPFAIDSVTSEEGKPLTASYDLLRQLTPLILAHQGQGDMAGVVPATSFDQKDVPTEQTVELGGYTLHVNFEKPSKITDTPGLDPGESLSGGLIICEGPNDFLIAGTGLIVTFKPRGDESLSAGIVSIEEGSYIDGTWTRNRWLGGDESHQGRHLRIPPGQFGIQRIKLYRYR
jgi:hypothetical protein